MFFYASTKCSFTATFTNDTVAMTTVPAASVISTQLTFPLVLLCLSKKLSYVHYRTLLLWFTQGKLLFTLFYARKVL